MSKQLIGVGTTANDGTGDPNRTAFQKTNANVTEIYATTIEPIAATTVSGTVNYPREVANTPAASATNAVVIGMGGLVTHNGTQTMPAPSHNIGVIGRAINMGSGLVTQSIGVEGRVDAQVGNITEAIGVLPITGPDTLNAGTVSVWTGYKFSDFSSGYTRLTTRNAILVDDSGGTIATLGQVYGAFGRKLGSVAQTNSGGEVASPNHAGTATGVRYSSAMTVAGAALPLTANTIYYVPVYIPERITLATFGINITVASATFSGRIGLWPLGRGVVGTKLAECTAFSVGATGDISGAVAGSIVAEAGQYLLGICTNGTPTIKSITDYTLGGILGVTNAAADDTFLTTAFTYGTLPSTPTLTRTTNSGWLAPYLYLTRA